MYYISISFDLYSFLAGFAAAVIGMTMLGILTS